MKALLRILIFAAVLLIGFFYFDSSITENEMLEAPRPMDPLPARDLIEMNLQPERPEEGISVYIGQSTQEWLADYGMPARIEPSAFGYEWWIYNQSYTNYLMAGVKEGEVVQVYTAGTEIDAAPYRVGQKLKDLYRFTIVENEVTVKYGTNIYTFTLAPEDLSTRLLVRFDGLYAQVYVDAIREEIEAVRFMNAETLIMHRPYDMLYDGELPPSRSPSSTLQRSIDEANANQLMDLANVYRLHHQYNALEENRASRLIAASRALEMAQKNLTSSAEQGLPPLNEALDQSGIAYNAAAENTASQYLDAAEAVHGWSNSPDHRETMLSSDYNMTGAGVFGKYYTLLFLEQKQSNAENQ